MLPHKFLERMKTLLGSDFAAFLSALEGDAVRGLRVNTLKCSAKDFLEETTLPLRKTAYSEVGFILDSDEGVGKLCEHHSGRIYMQDPGAMAPLSAIDIPLGARVVDLCAAPGGKSGQAAAMIGDGGFLLSNEFVPKRAKTLVSNFERLGIKCAVVTSMDTDRLPELFENYFDYAIVDAPCSGEGMFRKNSVAEEQWSEDNVRISAQRQRKILANAAKLVRGGGYIIYSTCTYSKEENEMTVDAFLKDNPSFTLVPPKSSVAKVTAPAVSFPEVSAENLHFARRFYPHLCEGEGQFFAIMQKDFDGKTPTILYKDASKPLSREESAAVNSFLKENLISPPDARVAKVGENIVLIPHGVPPIPQGSVFMSGVLLGEIKKGRLLPSHQFFSAYADFFIRKVELSGNAESLEKYLCGEEISAPDATLSGYCVLTYKGTALGGGKASLGRIKNHYPKGLRNKRV